MAKSIPAQEFKAAVKSLNKVLKEQGESTIKIVGAKKDDIVEEFTNTVLNFIDEGKEADLPDDVIAMYNDHIATEEEEEEEEVAEEKEEKKTTAKGKGTSAKGKTSAKKEVKPKSPKVGYEIIRAIVENENCLDRQKLLDEVAKVFPDRTKEGMATTVNHVVGVMTNYFNYMKESKK